MSRKKIILTSILGVLGALVLFVLCYVGYILLSYYRIEDNYTLTIEDGSSEEVVEVGKSYTISTYNIGFGAYSQDYTFFLDSGYLPDGTVVTGYYSTARSYDECLENVTGAINTISKIDADFMLFQEVDTNSTRSHKINQYQMIKDKFINTSSVYASNFHTAFLPYPLYDMHGKVEAGLVTVSKYDIQSAVRKSFTVATDLSKLFDLDRCFSYSEINVANNKKLIIVNVHMSAYDEGGVIRKAQREELNKFLDEMYSKGHYIIVGGDYNHDLLTYNPEYDYDFNTNPAFSDYIGMLKPDWLQQFFNSDSSVELANGFRVVSSDNAPTCRDASVNWVKGESYVTTIDGFIVSDNVEVELCETIITSGGRLNVEHFAYSDHDPVIMKFKLKE